MKSFDAEFHMFRRTLLRTALAGICATVLAAAPAGAQAPKARISLDGESAWLIFTGSIPRDEARRRATASGIPALYDPFFGVVAIMK